MKPEGSKRLEERIFFRMHTLQFRSVMSLMMGLIAFSLTPWVHHAR